MSSLRVRESTRCKPDWQLIADYTFPNELDYDNPIIGFEHYPDHRYGVNVLLKNGLKSELKNKFVNVESRLRDTDPEVRKVVIFCQERDTMLLGI